MSCRCSEGRRVPAKPALALLVLLLAACQNQDFTETIVLTPGATYPRAIVQGQPHRFQLHLSAGRFLRLDVEQRSVDVVVALRDPAGRLLLDEVDNPDSLRRPETVLAVTPVAGEYVLQVRPFKAGAEGEFVLVVREERPAGPEERRRAATAASLAQAERQWRDNDFERAAAGFRAVLPDLDRRGDRREAAHARWRLGTALARTGVLRESATVLERSAAGFRALGDGIGDVGEARALNDLGATWRLLGEPGLALRAYQRARDLYRQAGVLRGEASALNNIGIVRENTGDLQGAISQYEEALGIWQRLGDRSQEALTRQNLGSVYVRIGHDQEGLDLLQKALQLAEGETEPRIRRNALAALGWAEYLAGHPEQGLERLREATALAQSGGNRLEIAGLLDRQGSILKALDRLDEADAAYSRSLSISRAAGSPVNEGNTLTNLGVLHLERGDIERAGRELWQALGLLTAAGDPNGEASVRLALSRLERRRGAYGPARQQIETALERLEEQRAALRGLVSRGTFLSVRYDAWEELVTLLMELDRREPGRGHARKALEAAERARARNLLDLMTLTPGPSPVSGRDRKRALQAEIRAMDERRRALAARDPRDPRLPAVAAALRERSLELDRLSFPPSKGRGFPLSRKVGGRWERGPGGEVQDLADRDTLLVVYLLAEPASFAWTVDRERIVAHVLPGRKKIEVLAQRTAAALPQSHELTGRTTAETNARALADAILAPLAGRLASRPRLVILPDGALHLVPFAALPVGERVLLDDHEIVLIPSATVLVQQRRRLAGRPPAPGTVAVLADPIFALTDPRLVRGRKAGAAADDRGDLTLGFGPLARLPWTADEAQAIARLVPADRSLIAEGAAASRDLVLSGALSRYRILHFATHGLLHQVLPERSSIVLTLFDETGRPQDGFLTAPDVASLRLPADLVVLSACQTGLGREMRGEGLVGLTQAFFQAGARSIVVSSWNVRDRATADLMARFYTALLVERRPPAAALREAQLALRSDPKTAAPSYWAGFALHGDWR